MTDTIDVVERIVDLDTDDGPMAVVRKAPTADGDWPLIALFQDAPGIRDATHSFAAALAGSGYDVVVPDLYHREGRLIGFNPADVAADPGARDEIGRLLNSLTDDGIQHDLDVAMAGATAERPAGTTVRGGCIGFCLGARAVFRTMMRLPEQFVVGAMWHPSFLVDDGPDSPHLTAGDLEGSLYAGFGEDDHIMTVESMQPFIAAVEGLGDRASIDIHPGADHGYTWPDSATYSESAAQRAWAETQRLFATALH